MSKPTGTAMSGRTPFLASVVVILIVLAGFGYFYVTETRTISGLRSSVSSQAVVIQGDGSTITELQSAVATLQASVSTLQGNVTAYQSLVQMLRSTVASDEAQISALQGTVNADNATIASLRAQISTANAMIQNLTATVNLQVSKGLVSGQNVTIYGNSTTSVTPFLTFNPSHAGYLLIQVSNPTNNFLVESSQTPSPSNPNGAIYVSVTGISVTSPYGGYLIIPLVPGTSASFALIGNTSSNGWATVTATYFY